MGGPFSVFWGTSKLTSIVVRLISILLNSVPGLPFAHILTSICCYFFFFSASAHGRRGVPRAGAGAVVYLLSHWLPSHPFSMIVGVTWSPHVVCISPMAGELYHLFSFSDGSERLHLLDMHWALSLLCTLSSLFSLHGISFSVHLCFFLIPDVS